VRVVACRHAERMHGEGRYKGDIREMYGRYRGDIGRAATQRACTASEGRAASWARGSAPVRRDIGEI